MATAHQLHMRVNGIDVESVKVRRKMVEGIPVGEREIVINDPTIGSFAIDDTFDIESTTDRRRKWKKTSVQNFLAMIDTIEYSS